MTRISQRASLVGLCLVAILSLPSGVAAAATRLTTAVGTTSGGRELDASAGLRDGDALVTEEEGGCSVLVDGDALMEVCENTSLQIERKGGARDGSRVVKLDRGEIRMVVEPRLGEQKIEIHTPAAIATVLGTILQVAVDTNGVTTVTSEVSRVLVESADPSVSGATTIEGGQQIVVQPGQAPPSRPKKLSPGAIANLGGCLIDFRESALRSARVATTQAGIDAAVAEDVADAALPYWSFPSVVSMELTDSVSTTVNELPDPATDPPFPTAAPLPVRPVEPNEQFSTFGVAADFDGLSTNGATSSDSP